MLARWPLVCYDTKGYFDDVKICQVTINTYADVKAGADVTLVSYFGDEVYGRI